MAAAAAERASSPEAPCTYDVFLSFRGADTRKGFTGHLYSALMNAGVHTFRDSDEILGGEEIESEIKRAIRESKLSVIVFSKDYASSTYCLDELVMIMNRRKSAGHIVVPVFYDADPSLVSEQTETYSQAFAIHEQRFKPKKVKKWRKALRKITDLRGLVLEDKNDSEFIEEIVGKVRKKLNRAILHVTRYLVGVESVVQKVNLWLQAELDVPKIAVIYGAAGIGKTTIAQTVYNSNYDRFEGSGFLANVGETSKRHNGLRKLQRQLVSEICKGNAMEINNPAQGTMEIKYAVCCRKVLIVLDDVDDADQFEKLIGMEEWLSRGSKIIVTTRCVDLLSLQDCWRLKIRDLEYEESLKLFSFHAFGQAHPRENYRQYSEQVVKYCGGLPLALEVLGSHLSRRKLECWDSALLKLKAIPPRKVFKKLRISYDSLEHDLDKYLLLDIACFFIRMDMHVAAIILNDIYNAAMTSDDRCHGHAIDGIQTLLNRCLITVDCFGRLGMHDLVRVMAREIIRQESPDNLGGRRLWNWEDTLNVLERGPGTDSIRGLILTLPKSVEGSDSSYRSHGNSFPRSNKENLKTSAFAKMQNLKYLLLSHVELDGGFEHLPKDLIWLDWHGFSLESIPTTFDLESLLVLEMRNSSLIHAWKETKCLRRLKILDLSHSHLLVATPDFTGLTSLERLILKDCVRLVEIHESIGHLEKLVLLNLEDCKSLGKLPSEIARLSSLEELILSGCSSLLAEENTNSLKKLLGNGIGTASTRSEITTNGDEGSICILSTTWQWCLASMNYVWPRKKLKRMQSLFDILPNCLVELTLSHCNILAEALPRDFSRFPLLKKLDLSGNPFDSLAEESFKGLDVLQSLHLSKCKRLRALPEIPTSLIDLDVSKCLSLQRVGNLANLLPSMTLDMSHCEESVEVEGMIKLGPVTDANVEMINGVGLFNLGITTESAEVKMLNLFANAWARKSSLEMREQILHEFGRFRIFVPPRDVSSSLMLMGPAPAGYCCWVHPVYPPISSSGSRMAVVGVPCGTSSLCTGWGLHRSEVTGDEGPDGDAITAPALVCPPPLSSSDSTPGIRFSKGCSFTADWDPEDEHQLRPRCFQKGSFQIPYPRFGHRFCGFNLYVKYRSTGDPASSPDCDTNIKSQLPIVPRHDFYIHVAIRNITLGLKWVYIPTFLGAPTEGNGDMLWMSHWKFREHQFRTGDKVDVEVASSSTGFTEVKEFGIHLVHKQDDHEKGAQSNHDQEGTSLRDLTRNDEHTSEYKGTVEDEHGKIEETYDLKTPVWVEHHFVRSCFRDILRPVR